MTGNNLSKSRLRSKMIRVRNLDVVWAEAQRPMSKRKVNEIATNLDDRAFGVITVADIGGTYHIIDGQHRVAAVRKLWGDTEYVPCQVIEDVSSPAEAAEVWLVQNTDRTKPTAYDRFNVAVVAGKEPELSVAAIIQGCGYEVKRGGLMAVSACTRAYKKVGPDGLRWVLLTLKDIWGDEPDATNGYMIEAFSDFYEKFYDKLDQDRLVKHLQKSYTSSRLIGMGKQAREMFKGRLSNNIVRVMVQAYNQHFRVDSPGKLSLND